MTNWGAYLSELAELPEKERRNLWQLSFERARGSNARPWLCRIEHFVTFHDDFYHVANGWLKRIVGELMREEVCLLKEKLNYKGPGGGGGYAPHCDGPSCAAFSDSTRFITAMIALTPHTVDNGCMLVCPGRWRENDPNTDCLPRSDCCSKCDDKDLEARPYWEHRVRLTTPTVGGGKGGAGRVGALTSSFVRELEEKQRFHHVECPAGSVLLFDGWVPHRSAVNTTGESRNAIFFIYNAKKEGGDQHAQYYERFHGAR